MMLTTGISEKAIFKSDYNTHWIHDHPQDFVAALLEKVRGMQKLSTPQKKGELTPWGHTSSPPTTTKQSCHSKPRGEMQACRPNH